MICFSAHRKHSSSSGSRFMASKVSLCPLTLRGGRRKTISGAARHFHPARVNLRRSKQDQGWLPHRRLPTVNRVFSLRRHAAFPPSGVSSERRASAPSPTTRRTPTTCSPSKARSMDRRETAIRPNTAPRATAWTRALRQEPKEYRGSRGASPAPASAGVTGAAVLWARAATWLVEGNRNLPSSVPVQSVVE